MRHNGKLIWEIKMNLNRKCSCFTFFLFIRFLIAFDYSVHDQTQPEYEYNKLFYFNCNWMVLSFPISSLCSLNMCESMFACVPSSNINNRHHHHEWFDDKIAIGWKLSAATEMAQTARLSTLNSGWQAIASWVFRGGMESYESRKFSMMNVRTGRARIYVYSSLLWWFSLHYHASFS